MKNKEKREKNNIKKITLSVNCGMTSSNLIHIIRVPNRKKTLGRKERQKKIGRNNDQKFSKFDKNYKPTYAKRPTNAKLMKPEENYSKTHIIKFLKISGKGKKNPKAARKKGNITHIETNIKIVYMLSEATQSRRDWKNILKYRKKK